MSGLIWLDADTPIPEPEFAMPEGLVAAGTDLGVPRLIEAYSKGVFPWFNEGDPVLWWSPDPRMILGCDAFKASQSLRKKLRQIARHEREPGAKVVVTTDLAFRDVIRACAGPRATQAGTWISGRIIDAYTQWHHLGQVHSVETWIDGELAGGLYGVCLGGFFFGESMFSWVPDSSKIALAYLVRFLGRHGVMHLDCQQNTRHLASLGARTMPRSEFLALLREALDRPSPPWRAGQLLHDGQLMASGTQAPQAENE
ncbi:leucyl/phenylalanyl-tRNA--protein transferase [bacterium SGD-2]|nr:leucyl/phenylalanyl-tRNA--protein transferase [bacterium SGD-2]